MKQYPLIGIVICILLITNVSAVLGGNTGEIHRGNFVGPNLAPNPSFEEGDTMPTGWTYSPNNTGIYHWDSDFAQSGLKSVGVMNLTDPHQNYYWTTDFIPVDFTLYTYVFSGWFKYDEESSDHHSAEFLVEEYDKNYNLIYNYGWFYGKYNSEWKITSNMTIYGKTETKYVKLVLANFNNYGELNPLCEIRFDDIYFGVSNTAPDVPTITGETHGKVRTLYTYSFITIDPEEDEIRYWIEWGDNKTTNTTYYKSGQEVNISHIWGNKGTYNVRVKAIDEHHKESDWANLSVTMPCSYNIPFQQFWMKLLERFPNAFPILRFLLDFDHCHSLSYW